MVFGEKKLPKKLVFSLIITLLLASMLTLAFNACRVEAEGAIYIKADGSIEGTTSIQTVDNITYLFLADINGSIIIERDYIMLDGAGHTLQGTGTGTGISLSGRTNVTVQKTQITAFEYGVYVYNCTNSTISGNNIVKNVLGILFRTSSTDSDVSSNNITANGQGIRTDGWTSGYDTNKIYKIYHNNFVNNTYSHTLGWVGTIFWNLSYPSGGNYWSDYDGIDSNRGPYQNESGSDGIGDSPYTLSVSVPMGAYVFWIQDYYPLSVPFGSNLPLAFPTADFTYAPNEPLVNQTVLFNASTSTCIDGTIVRYKWDFGDGRTDTGPTVSHVYEIQGNYNVTLIVISNTQIPDIKSQTFFIGRVPAWQTWTAIGAAVTLMAVVAIILFLGLRRGRLKKAERQTKLLSGEKGARFAQFSELFEGYQGLEVLPNRPI
jgi:parallel beta-helix repeat protein